MKKKLLYTTFSKMTLSFVLFGLIPLLLLSMLFFFRYSGNVRENMTQYYTSMTKYISLNVGDMFSSVDESMGELYNYESSGGYTLAYILKDTRMSDSDKELAVSEVLQDIMWKNSAVSSVRLVDVQGNIYSSYYSQDKVLRNDAEEFTSMDVFPETADKRDLLIFSTIAESNICLNTDDYVFEMVRNYMDITNTESARVTALATLFVDLNVKGISDIIDQTNLNVGHCYVYSSYADGLIYSDDGKDYLGGENPLEFCLACLEGDSGYTEIDHQWVFYEKVDKYDAYTVYVVDNSDVMGSFFQTRLMMLLILCFSCAFLLILYMTFSIYMSEPTRKLKEAMEQVEKGNLDARVYLYTHDEMAYVAEGFNNMIEKLSDYIDQVYVAQICQKDAELSALKMQIQPHYLYNTLDVIRMTALDQGDKKTAELLESLAHNLRYTIGSQSDRATLKEELDAIREYFVIARARYEGRVSLNIYATDEDCRLVIPKLLLQPVVENALRHGLKEKEGNGAVAIRVERHTDYLEITVMDDGVGMEEEAVREMQDMLEHSERVIGGSGKVSIGMKNVYDRIKLNCGEEYGFVISSVKGMGTIVTYRLPIWEEGTE